MALDGAQLQVTISADVSPLLGAMNEASAAVSTSAGQMAASFKSVGASEADARAEMVALGYSAEETAAALDNVGFSGERAGTGLRGTAAASAQARVELASMTGSTGAMEFGLAKLGATSATLGPLISAAFPVFAVAAFAEIADQAAGKVEKLYEHFVTLKDQEDEVTAATTKLAESTYQYGQEALRAREAALGTLVGPAAEAKQKLEDLASTVYPLKIDDKDLKDAKQDVRDFIDSLKSAEGGIGVPAEQIRGSISRVTDELKRQQKIAEDTRAEMAADAAGGDAGALAGMDQQAHQAEINASALKIVLTNLLSMQQDYAGKKQELDDSGYAAERADAQRALQEDLADTKEKYTVQEQASLASIEQQEKALKAKVAANQISDDEDIAQQRTLDAQKDAIESAAEKRQRAAEEARKAQEAADRLSGQQLRDQSELASYSDKLARADLDAINKKIKGEEDLALATIRGGELVSAAHAKADEAQAARDLRDKRITPDQEGALLGADETKRHTGKVDELNQLKSVEQDPAKLKELDAQMLEEETNFHARMKQIADDAASKTNEAQLKSYDQLISAATESANRQLEVAVRADEEKLKHHDVSAQQWVTSERSSLDQWYSEQATILNAAEAFAARTYGKDSEQYAALQRKKEQLDQEYVAKSTQITSKLHEQWLQITRKMGSEFESTINKLVMGQESWAKISKGLYSEVANQFVTNSVKMVEQEVVAAATHKAMLKTEILGDAYTSAAHAFKWVMTDVPFPANAVLAPAAAAAAFGAVMAFGSFETGGVAQITGPYVLHAGEGVMTARQTAAIERAGDVTNNSGARTMHQNVTVNHNGGGMSDAEMAKVMHRVMRKGLFRLG